MMNDNINEKLTNILTEATILLGDNSEVVVFNSLMEDDIAKLNTIILVSESRKAILTVLITLLFYKILHPNQDIRNHKVELLNGFSGRTFDTKHITPFMKLHRFPAMAETGWLTRTLEQSSPYTLNYTGRITPKKAKTAFLELLHSIEGNTLSSKDCLLYIFQKLIIHRNGRQINLIVNPLKEKNISISHIIELLEQHFVGCSEVGRARLPVLALYSVYECIIGQLNRYSGKYLQKLESHTSADARSGGVGDIDVLNEKDDEPFESVEVKYGKPITAQMIMDAYEKFKIYPVNRYYLLSTEISSQDEKAKIDSVVKTIASEHGCQVIVNGVIHTLKYYLRLIQNTNDFIDKYTYYVETDAVIKVEHKNVWNQLVIEKMNDFII